MATLLKDKYEVRKAEVNARFEQLRTNEEELNRIFAKIYNMEGEVPIEVEDKYVSVARIFDTADEIPESYKGNKYVRTKRDEITSLISYAVGCMFGRYSLDVDGLVLADQGATVDDYLAKMPNSDHVTFMPDSDNVLPITDDEYFDDDIVRYLIDFVRTVYGEETLEQNLAFIAEALGSKGTSREVIRTYFLKDFFKDHCQTYKKRPIYWLFDSGKKNGFKCLVYMHRFSPTCWLASAPTMCMGSKNATAPRSAMPTMPLPMPSAASACVWTSASKSSTTSSKRLLPSRRSCTTWQTR